MHSKTPRKPNFKKHLTRIEILRHVARETQVSMTKAKAMMQSLTKLLHTELGKKGSGTFIIPLVGIKVRRIKRPATKARTMKSPLTGTDVTISAKPAHVKVKVSVLKALKEAVLK